MRDLEMRHVAQPVEFRDADGEGSPGVLEGYAIVFNKYSQNLGGFVEQVDPAAVRKSLADATPVVARYNHDDNFLLGTTEAGTLVLTADEVGVRYRVDLPNTSAGRDTAALAKRGDLRYSSFAFHTVSDDWGVTERGFPLRTLTDIQMVDVAPVVTPAYRDSSVGLRSLAAAVHMDVDAVLDAPVEEIRMRIESPTDVVQEISDAETRSDEQEGEGQGDTHPHLDLLKRQLELLMLKP